MNSGIDPGRSAVFTTILTTILGMCFVWVLWSFNKTLALIVLVILVIWLSVVLYFMTQTLIRLRSLKNLLKGLAEKEANEKAFKELFPTKLIRMIRAISRWQRDGFIEEQFWPKYQLELSELVRYAGPFRSDVSSAVNAVLEAKGQERVARRWANRSSKIVERVGYIEDFPGDCSLTQACALDRAEGFEIIGSTYSKGKADSLGRARSTLEDVASRLGLEI